MWYLRPRFYGRLILAFNLSRHDKFSPCITSTRGVHSRRFHTHSEAFTLTRARTIAFNWIQYSLKGNHVHSRTFNCIQLHVIEYNTCSKVLIHTQARSIVSTLLKGDPAHSLACRNHYENAFSHIQTHSKAFTRTQACSIAFNSIQFLLKIVRAHSSMFSGSRKMKAQWICA